ncbi:MAG: GIY-YIG nuclease family protein [Ignavibacteriales bacterium]|nr:MAG: GIY-YIG nuclease family protein [Ignavibacteriaceae bacterium]MBW7872709.1 GIY-YIG nuclease family protein [Ignavibacteria bacterium]MCZ2143429.1 GIY-YIG nuclease family protein [Ignavibacteriales bacterium]OQY71582.1 MAG: excinuclease ABC subunit C [Ignavibacteriales bacterium UTCHB3]MBZ0196000.1 GIY-YIG nuclease family protein [Ignavibacteriaceae bacterium]
MFYLFILYSQTLDKYYIGQTSNLEDRVKLHNTQRSKFTSRATDWELISTEQFSTRSEATQRESQLKKLKSRKVIQELTGHSM